MYIVRGVWLVEKVFYGGFDIGLFFILILIGLYLVESYFLDRSL